MFSFVLAQIIAIACISLVVFSTIMLVIYRDKISHTPDKLIYFSSLFSEVKNKNELATYYFIFFFMRRMLFA